MVFEFANKVLTFSCEFPYHRTKQTLSISPMACCCSKLWHCVKVNTCELASWVFYKAFDKNVDLNTLKSRWRIVSHFNQLVVQSGWLPEHVAWAQFKFLTNLNACFSLRMFRRSCARNICCKFVTLKFVSNADLHSNTKTLTK